MLTCTALTLVIAALGCRDTLEPRPARLSPQPAPAVVVVQDTLLPARDAYVSQGCATLADSPIRPATPP